MISPLASQHDALTAIEHRSAFTLRTGRVLPSPIAGAVLVHMEGQDRSLRCAASCLLNPEPGDLVLVADNAGEAYILAVLERPGPAPAVLGISTPSQTVIVRAKRLVMRGEEEVEITAPRTDVKGARLTVAVDTISFIANLLTQTLKRWQGSAKNIDMVATDIATKAARRIAIVDEIDTLRAGSVLQKIEATSVTDAHAVVIAANEDLRLDGTRVTVG